MFFKMVGQAGSGAVKRRHLATPERMDHWEWVQQEAEPIHGQVIWHACPLGTRGEVWAKGEL